MRFVLSLALVATPVAALADDNAGAPQILRIEDRDQAVIGGTQAPADKWPDAAAVLWGSDQGCSGTLIAPTLVITAGHCVIGGAPNYVLVGSVYESGTQGGERIRIQEYIEYPRSQSTVDAAVLVLERAATVAPRAVATGWAQFDIANGASVALVGFGTTDRDGNIDSPTLMEAMSTITDFNCTTSSGCNYDGRPNGELGAGGNGIDTCPGDSGGPLYLTTSYGSFLAGITSRGYNDNNYYCSEGGIYGRPDKIVEWIETMTGVAVTKGPTPAAVGGKLTAVRGNAGEVQIEHHDPKATDHTYAIVTQPGYGKAAISDSGVLRVCANGDVIGDDIVTVSVTDAADATRTVQTKVQIIIEDGDPAGDCDETAFGEETGGCCDTRRSAGGSLPLVLVVGALLVRRRRR